MTELSEADRSRFYTEVAAALSPESAEILMHEVLEVHWEDLVTKADLADLRGEFAGLKGDYGDLRSEMRVGFARVDTRFEQMNARLERQLRVQLVWLIATLLTIAGMLIALG